MMEFVQERLKTLGSPLMRWWYLAIIWFGFSIATCMSFGYQLVETSHVAELIDFDDIPFLHFVQLHRCDIIVAEAATGVCFLAGLVFYFPLLHKSKMGIALLVSAGFALALSFWRSGLPMVQFLAAGLSHFFQWLGDGFASSWGNNAPEFSDYLDHLQSAPRGFFDWLFVLSFGAAACCLVWVLSRTGSNDDLPKAPRANRKSSRLNRAATIYLLCCASIFVYALKEHEKFWDETKNGGFNYKQFFRQPAPVGEHEVGGSKKVLTQIDVIQQANMVLYSTSLLFASLAAMVAVVGYFSFQWLSNKGRSTGSAIAGVDCRRQALGIGALLTVSLICPWLIKIWPDFSRESAWIFPVTMLVFPFAALTPLVMLCSLMLKRDFDEVRSSDNSADAPSGATDVSPDATGVSPVLQREHGQDARATQSSDEPAEPPVDEPLDETVPVGSEFVLRRSEYAFLSMLLFPLYPFVRLFRFRIAPLQYTVLMLLAVGVIRFLIWFLDKLEKWYTFDDWRDMIKASQFPFFRVLFSVWMACFIYLCWRRLAGLWAEQESKPQPLSVVIIRGSLRWSFNAAAVVCLVIATWPFWGWHSVRKDVFARTIEFSSRHQFDLKFLHWVFDFDRDGYAALLHGSDTNDWDSSIQGGGIARVEPVEVPTDQFKIVESEKARRLPNVVIFFLEGVIPKSITAYGMRHLSNGRKATPYIDALADEGTLFTQARCGYPSTWDGWYAVNSGRLLRVMEMSTAEGDMKHYSRFNNLRHVLKLAGFNRWCHGTCSAYREIFVSDEDALENWEHDFSASELLTEEKVEQEIWEGDVRNERMLRFIDDLEPGDRFFMAEHMSDTHFDWKETSDKRAAELGFPDGLAFAKEGAGPWEDMQMYYQTITRMDAQIGQIVNRLKDRGFYDNTIFMVISDHGCQWWEHERMYYVSHLYEPSLLIPMIIRVPGMVQGKRCDTPVWQWDVLPTILDLAGIELVVQDPSRRLIGRSMLPLMRGESNEQIEESFRNRDMLLITHYDKIGVLHNSRYKLIFERPTGTYRLFDLKDDPGEMINLADSDPKLLEEMMELIRKLSVKHKVFLGGIKHEQNGP